MFTKAQLWSAKQCVMNKMSSPFGRTSICRGDFHYKMEELLDRTWGAIEILVEGPWARRGSNDHSTQGLMIMFAKVLYKP